MPLWLAAVLSIVISFVFETRIEGVIMDLANKFFDGSTLFIVIANALSFLGIFSVLFAVFTKVFGSRGSGQ